MLEPENGIDWSVYSDEDHNHPDTRTRFDRVKDTFGNELDRLKIAHGGRILDIGCSSGITTVELAYRFGPSIEVIGVDINQTVLGREAERAKSYYSMIDGLKGVKSLGNVKFKHGDGFQMAESLGLFDAIFIMNNLYYSIAYDKVGPTALKSKLQMARNAINLFQNSLFCMFSLI